MPLEVGVTSGVQDMELSLSTTLSPLTKTTQNPSAYALDTNRNIWTSEDMHEWKRMPMPDPSMTVSDLAAGPRFLWGVTSDRKVIQCEVPCDMERNRWRNLPGSLTSIEQQGGLVVGVSPKGRAFLTDEAFTKGWTQLETKFNVKQVSIAQNSTWAVDKRDRVYKKTSNDPSWKEVDAPPLKSVAAGDEHVWGIDRDSNVYACKQPCQDGKWLSMQGKLASIDQKNGNIFGVAPDGSIVEASADIKEFSGWHAYTNPTGADRSDNLRGARLVTVSEDRGPDMRGMSPEEAQRSIRSPPVDATRGAKQTAPSLPVFPGQGRYDRALNVKCEARDDITFKSMVKAMEACDADAHCPAISMSSASQQRTQSEYCKGTLLNEEKCMSVTTEFKLCGPSRLTAIAGSGSAVDALQPVLLVKPQAPLPSDQNEDDVTYAPGYIQSVPTHMELSSEALPPSAPGWPKERGVAFKEIDYGGGTQTEGGKTQEDCVEIGRLYELPNVGYRTMDHPDPPFRGTCFFGENADFNDFIESEGRSDDPFHRMFDLKEVSPPGSKKAKAAKAKQDSYQDFMLAMMAQQNQSLNAQGDVST